MHKVLGMGNALVDLMTRIDKDELLDRFGLPKGSMILVDEERASLITQETQGFDRIFTSGGSAANTIHGLAKLGIPAGYIGKIGNDEFGQIFKNDLISSGIESNLIIGQALTGRAVALMSPDAERTFAVYLGAAIELTESDLTPKLFEGYTIFHVEGYLVQNRPLITKAVKLAKEAGLIVSLDLASYNVVAENLDFLQDIVKQYVDIVFANEEEAKSFTGLEPLDALHALGQHCTTAIVKVGKHGSHIKHEGQVYKVGVINARSIDTTGAGDLYASGYLYGYVNGYTPDICGQIGSLLAGTVIEHVGAKIPESKWEQLQLLIHNI
jgi:sugar/nucleoside kinase (ribokinase family)